MLQIAFSPIAALNRSYALFKATNNSEMAIRVREVEKLILENNHLYFALLAEKHAHSNTMKSCSYLNKALNLAKNDWEQQLLKKISKI